MTGKLFDSRDSGGSGKMVCHPRLRLGRQTIFPDPPESLESNSITCHPLDQSLFVYYNMAILTAQQLRLGTDMTKVHTFMILTVTAVDPSVHADPQLPK